jgi:hypothetical protein
MDKRKIANQEVRDKFFQALMSLLKEKPASEITITELISHSGAARVSFYRNYKSINDVLYDKLDAMIEEYNQHKLTDFEKYDDYEFILNLFLFYKKYADVILTANRANISIDVLDEISDYLISINGDMKENSIRKYELYYYSGAWYNVVIHWLESGMKESPEDMAAEFIRIGKN